MTRLSYIPTDENRYSVPADTLAGQPVLIAGNIPAVTISNESDGEALCHTSADLKAYSLLVSASGADATVGSEIYHDGSTPYDDVSSTPLTNVASGNTLYGTVIAGSAVADGQVGRVNIEIASRATSAASGEASSASSPNTVVVADGSGDFTGLVAAINAASDGDIIEMRGLVTETGGGLLITPAVDVTILMTAGSHYQVTPGPARIFNVITNTIKFMGSGLIEVQTPTASVALASGTGRIELYDTVKLLSPRHAVIVSTDDGFVSNGGELQATTPNFNGLRLTSNHTGIIVQGTTMRGGGVGGGADCSVAFPNAPFYHTTAFGGYGANITFAAGNTSNVSV